MSSHSEQISATITTESLVHRRSTLIQDPDASFNDEDSDAFEDGQQDK